MASQSEELLTSLSGLPIITSRSHAGASIPAKRAPQSRYLGPYSERRGFVNGMIRGGDLQGGGNSTQCRVSVLSSSAAGRRRLERILRGLGHKIVAWSLEPDQPANKTGPAPAAIFFEVAGSAESQLQSLRKLIKKLSPIPVIVVSISSEVASIVQAVNLGAEDYLVSPPDDTELEQLITRALTRLLNGHVNKKESSLPFLAASPAMRSLKETATRLADSDVTVLITGESGSGKEVVARHIHQCSRRSGKPFVKVNCAALPEELLESELFGYEPGAFTGAVSRKLGKFEVANHGMIFLDEISQMSTRLQAKLLQVLQDKQFDRLGGTNVITVDVQVLAATNEDLVEEVEAGRFREDLYFRLKVIDLHVPALRERREEIPLLIEYFLERFAGQYLKPVPELSDQLLGLLFNHRWPGNVRELENIIKRIVILGDETSVIRDILSKRGQQDITVLPEVINKPQEADFEARDRLGLKEVGQRAARAAEREAILRMLRRTHWNRRKASTLLEVSYKTLLTKMKECGLNEK